MSSDRTIAVAAGHPSEVAAGIRILNEGGNSVDAVLAGAFCAAVVEPNNAGLAGYGHLVTWDPTTQTFLSVDHGPWAPGAAQADMFAVTSTGEVDAGAPYDAPSVPDGSNANGGRATAIPGAVRGMCEAHALAGRLPLAAVLAPAIELAQQGFLVDWPFALVAVNEFDRLRSTSAAAAWALTDGQPPRATDHWGPGSQLAMTGLCETLQRIASDGPTAFYEGSIANAIVAALSEAGGVMTLADLAAYRPRVSREMPTTFGACAIAVGDDDLGHLLFGLLDRLHLPMGDPLSADVLHLMAEAFGHVFADAVSWSGDPAITPHYSQVLRSAEYASLRATAINRHRATARPIAPGPVADGVLPGSGGTDGTTQVVARDADGGMSVIITTIGQDFGGGTFIPAISGFGNSGMANFDPRPGRSNSIAPFKRPLFGVPAAIAVDQQGTAVAAAAGSGGWAITSSVTHAMVNALHHGLTARDSVDLPRVWCEGGDTFVDDRIPAATIAELEQRGHPVTLRSLTPASEPFARCSLIAINASGETEAASDPSWHGAAEVGSL
jgi:gamma-glutamyltranspeptidase/glutathione hydrolase